MNSYSRITDPAVSRSGLKSFRLVSPLSASASDSVRAVFWVQWLVGVSLQLGLLVVLASAKTGEVAPEYRSLAVMAVLGSIPLYAIFRVYSVQYGHLIGLARLLAGWSTLIAALIFLTFVTKTSALFSREVVLQWIAGGYLLQAVAFVPFHHLLQRFDAATKNGRRSVIVGTDKLAQALANALREPVVGFVEIDDLKLEHLETYGETQGAAGFQILGKVSHLRSLLREHKISRVYIALPARMTDQIEGLYVDLLDSSVDVVWIPDVANMKLLNHSVQSVGGLPAVHLNESPLTSHPGSALLKTAMDRLLALSGILILSPLLIGIAIAVKLSSPGPVLFRQQRHGWNGNIIEVLKFRSMRLHDDNDVKQAQRNDSRITRVGSFIRRSSIDELPQLFNVLKGDMSLVGPRPHAVAHNNYYSDKILAYMARHRIRPGITGHAQVNGCRGETETIDKMQKRVELDLEYINNWSLWLDIKILVKTPLSLFSDNIY